MNEVSLTHAAGSPQCSKVFIPGKWWNSNIFHYLLLIGILTAVYYPVAFGYYLLEDDYWSYLDRHASLINNQAFRSQAFFAARPLGALINYLSLMLVRGISDLNYVRALSISIICGCSCLLFFFMKKFEVRLAIRFTVSVIVFLAMSFQSNVLKTFEINALLSALFAIGSALLSIGFVLAETQKRERGLLAATFFLQIMILMTYTNGITFYWVPMFIYISQLSAATFKKQFRRLLLAAAVPIFSMVVFAVCYKFFLVKDPGQNLMINLQHIPKKLVWFYVNALPVGLDSLGLITLARYKNLWAFDLANSANYLILFLSLAGLVGIALREIKSSVAGNGHWKFMVLKTALLLIIFWLSISPLFFSKDTSTCYRRFQAMQAMFLYMAISGIAFLVPVKGSKFSNGVFAIILSGVILLFALKAHETIRYKVDLLSEELRFIRKVVEDSFTNDTKLIHIIQPDKISQLHDFVGLMTANISWVPGIVSAVMQDLPEKKYGDVKADWNLGEATNKVTASPLKDVNDNRVVVDKRTTVLVNMKSIEYLLNSDFTLYNHKTFHAMRPVYNTENSAPIVKDFSSCCDGGVGLSSGDYAGFSVSGAYDNDFVSTRWACNDVGSDIYHNAFLGYDFGNGNLKIIQTIVIRQASTLKSVLVQGSNDLDNWIDVAKIRLVQDSNVRAYKIRNDAGYSKWRLLADDVLPHPAAWAVYEVKFLE